MPGPALLATSAFMREGSESLVVRQRHCSFGACSELAEPRSSERMPPSVRRASRLDPGSVGQDHVVAFDFSTGGFLGPVVHMPRLNGQALVLLD